MFRADACAFSYVRHRCSFRIDITVHSLNDGAAVQDKTRQDNNKSIMTDLGDHDTQPFGV